jgi:hypothetical protein
VHNSVFRRAVEQGENSFSLFLESEVGQDILENYRKSPSDVTLEMAANKVLEALQKSEKHSKTIRSELLLLDPRQVSIDELTKRDEDGSFLMVKASHQMDLLLVIFMVKAMKTIPINDNGDSIIFNTSDEKGELYVSILKNLLEKLLQGDKNAYKEDKFSNILHRLVAEYKPDVDLSPLKSLAEDYFKGPNDINMKNLNGTTLLHVVRNGELCDHLVSLGADIDAKGRMGATPLHSACERYPTFAIYSTFYQKLLIFIINIIYREEN